MKLCECKCGEEIIWKHHHKYRKTPIRFINGHQYKLNPLCQKGRKVSDETKKKIKKARANQIMKIKWTKEKLIEKAQKIYKIYGPLSIKEWDNVRKKENFCSISKIHTLFGTFNNFAKECNIKIIIKKDVFTKQTIKKYAQKIYKIYGPIKRTDWITIHKKEKFCTEPTIRKFFGTFGNFAKECNIKFKFIRPLPESWPKEKIIKNAQKIYKKYGIMYRHEWSLISKKECFCSGETIRRNFITMDVFAKECDIIIANGSFILGHIGKNEKFILDKIEKEKNINLERQFFCNRYFIDGYDKINNIAYEVDEYGHYNSTQQIKDKIRENNIKEIIPGVKFIRINEQAFLEQIKNKNQRNLGEFVI